MSKKAVDVPQLVYQTLTQFKGHEGATWLHPDDPFSEVAMRAYIKAVDETGEYAALVRQAKIKFAELYGEWHDRV